MPKWEQALKTGKEIEHELCQVIKRKYPTAKVINGYCKGYDIEVPEIKMTVEVKYDPKSEETENYLIEVEFNNEPSALTTTTADYWVIVDESYYSWIRPDALREIIKDFTPREFIGEGDSKAKKAYLVPRDSIRHHPYTNLVKRRKK